MTDVLTLQRELFLLQQTVRRLEQQNTQQAKQISKLGTDLALVNAKTQRTGQNLGSLAIGSQDVTLAWPNPWPDTVYAVLIELITGTAALGNLHATLKSKTTDNVTITVAASVAIGAASIDVVGVRT